MTGVPRNAYAAPPSLLVNNGSDHGRSAKRRKCHSVGSCRREGRLRQGPFKAFFNSVVLVQDLVHAGQLEDRHDLGSGAGDAEVTSSRAVFRPGIRAPRELHRPQILPSRWVQVPAASSASSLNVHPGMAGYTFREGNPWPSLRKAGSACTFFGNAVLRRCPVVLHGQAGPGSEDRQTHAVSSPLQNPA